MADRLTAAKRRVDQLGLRLLAALGRQAWLDRPSYRLEHMLTLAFAACGAARERIGNALHGTWLGHPLHPALTSLPIGSLAATLALDAASVIPRHRRSLREASRTALSIGIVGSLGALVTGLTDWQHTHEQPRRVGLVHGTLNVAATSLYVISWWDRRRSKHLRAVGTSALGYGVTLAGGYLGAALVYGFGIGVDRSGTRLELRDWTPVLPVSALQVGRPERIQLDGAGFVLYRTADDVLAVGERCPHLGAPMSDGWIDHGRIVCPWHGSRFSPSTGEVVRGPATAPLPCYSARIRDGMIELRNCSHGGVGAGGGVAK